MSRAHRLVAQVEHVVKKPVWGCQMCGQCVLHSTGMTCPMTCPKQLRNGPCGGVRANGHCEVKPEMKCVWVEAFNGSQHMVQGKEAIKVVQFAVDRRLQGKSSFLRVVKEKVGYEPEKTAVKAA